MNTFQKMIFNTSQQKVLYFLAENAGEEFTEKEISRKTGVKKSAVNLAARDLASEKVIKKKKIGRTSLFKADVKNSAIKEIKILQNIIKINPLIEKLKQDSQKIILFGSFASGENLKESDVDLFVLSNNPEIIRKTVNNSQFSERIQLIMKKPEEMLIINKKRPLLFQEIEKGKTLWEKNDEQ